MRYFLIGLLLAAAGCSSTGTYEQSRHLFTTTRDVPEYQEGWVRPTVLKIQRLPDRGDVHDFCNVVSDGGKGSHFNVLGIHWASVQDRGCYMYNPELSIGYILYLEGDLEALTHEQKHHYHGPIHTAPRPIGKTQQLSNRSSMRAGVISNTIYSGGGY